MTIRRFRGQRALRIAFRTLHLGAVAMLLGSAVFADGLGPWLEAVLLTGGLLVGEELYRYGSDWFRWLQSWVVLGKLALLVCVFALPAYQVPALWAALVMGSVISHAPGWVRQYGLIGEAGPCAAKPARSLLPDERRRTP